MASILLFAELEAIFLAYDKEFDVNEVAVVDGAQLGRAGHLAGGLGRDHQNGHHQNRLHFLSNSCLFS